MTYPVDDLGNTRVDFVFGNMPLQPNDTRAPWQQLGAADSHDIAATEWNTYPFLGDNKPGSTNYSVTGVEYLGGILYEYTSQNNLKVGDTVRTTGCPGYNGVATVVYASATRFRTENELPGTEKLTGLTGRVDVLTNSADGNTLEGGQAFYWPAVGFCNNTGYGPQNDIRSVIEYFVGIGVPREYFVDFTFSGGETPWDSNGDPNWDGAIWYVYVDPASVWGVDGSGSPIYGTAAAGQVAWGNWNANQEVSIDTGYPEDYSLVVLTNDPRKDNAYWWWN